MEPLDTNDSGVFSKKDWEILKTPATRKQEKCQLVNGVWVDNEYIERLQNWWETRGKNIRFLPNDFMEYVLGGVFLYIHYKIEAYNKTSKNRHDEVAYLYTIRVGSDQKTAKNAPKPLWRGYHKRAALRVIFETFKNRKYLGISLKDLPPSIKKAAIQKLFWVEKPTKKRINVVSNYGLNSPFESKVKHPYSIENTLRMVKEDNAKNAKIEKPKPNEKQETLAEALQKIQAKIELAEASLQERLEKALSEYTRETGFRVKSILLSCSDKEEKLFNREMELFEN